MGDKDEKQEAAEPVAEDAAETVAEVAAETPAEAAGEETTEAVTETGEEAPAEEPVAEPTDVVAEPGDETPAESAEPAAEPAPAPVRKFDKDSQAVYYGTGRRKEAVARVRLLPGSGNFLVNGRGLLEYFGLETLANQIRRPLALTGTLEDFDVVAKIEGGGIAGQAGALRHGIARALLEAGEDYRDELKRAGLLTRDQRMKERKKYGLKKARKAPQFSKR